MPVSYTHLDVYKRQVRNLRDAERNAEPVRDRGEVHSGPLRRWNAGPERCV